jgi:putative transposase
VPGRQGRGLGMVSDAQPHPPDLDPFRRLRPSTGVGPGSSAYAGLANARRRRTGHFWQGRFGAVAMDEDHLAATFRYVSLNPVCASLAARAQDWRWSSARAHLGLGADGVTDIADLLGPADDGAAARLRKAESVGRARIGGVHGRLEEMTNRRLRTAEAQAETTG